MVTKVESDSFLRAPLAGFLAWFIPGMGHIYLGDRIRGLILLVTITVTFWTGVALGSVQATVAPHSRKLWFGAQIGSGIHALAAYGLHRVVSPETATSNKPVVTARWLSAEVGVHYTGVAGLLNLLLVIDAIARADRTGASARMRVLAKGVT